MAGTEPAPCRSSLPHHLPALKLSSAAEGRRGDGDERAVLTVWVASLEEAGSIPATQKMEGSVACVLGLSGLLPVG